MTKINKEKQLVTKIPTNPALRMAAAKKKSTVSPKKPSKGGRVTHIDNSDKVVITGQGHAYPQSGIHATLLGVKPKPAKININDRIDSLDHDLGELSDTIRAAGINQAVRERAIREDIDGIHNRLNRLIPRVIFCAFSAGLLGYAVGNIIFALVGAK